MLLALLVLLIYLSPNIFFPEEARYLIHDNLDSNVVWYKNLAESGMMFAPNDAIVPNSLDGLPRGCYPPQFNLTILLFWLFPTLVAYNINTVLMHALAFFSMYVFAQTFIFKKHHQWTLILVSLCFSLLPFWPSGGAAVAGQPLLLYAFLNILSKNYNLKNWLIITVTPFYSTLAFVNLFFIPLLFLAFLVHSFVKKQFNVRFVLSLGLFVIVSVLFEYRLFIMQFVNHFENHRALLSHSVEVNFNGVIGISLLLVLKGHYHFFAGQYPFILLLTMLAMIFGNKKQKIVIAILLSCIFCLSMFYVLPNWKYLIDLLASNDLLNSITLRFYGLFPLLWFIILSYSVVFLLDRNLKFRFVIIPTMVLLILSLFFSFPNKDYYGSNYLENSFYNTYINNKSKGNASFKEYYSESLFK